MTYDAIHESQFGAAGVNRDLDVRAAEHMGPPRGAGPSSEDLAAAWELVTESQATEAYPVGHVAVAAASAAPQSAASPIR